MSFYGVFKELRDMDLPNTSDTDLYEGYFVDFYEYLTGDPERQYDIELYLSKAAQLHGPILELACGTGRVTIALAKRGYEVTGVDLSRRMLETFRTKLGDQPNRVKRRISIIQEDILSLSLERKFALAILPATSISLFLEDGDIERLLEVAHNHLDNDGLFIFDILSFDEDIHGVVDTGLSFANLTSTNGEKQFVLYGERRDFNTGVATMNLFAEVISSTGTTRHLGSTVKRMLSERQIRDFVTRTPFSVEGIRTMEYRGQPAIKTFVLRK